MDRFAPTNGIQIHYLDTGGDGEPLVLLHGLTANAHFFDALVDDGLGDRFRVISIDLRGRGLSDKPTTGYSIDKHVDDVIGLLDHLGLDTVHLGGHSFGGLLVFHLAANHPDRFRTCVVLDAPAGISPTVAEQVKPSLARLDVTLPSFDAYLEAIRAQPYYGEWWDPRMEAYFRADVEAFEDGSVRPRSTSAIIGEVIEAAVTTDWFGFMHDVRARTLFVRATGPYGPPGSPPICQEDAAKLTMGALPDARMVEVDGNHMTAFFGDGASKVALAISTFLQEAS